MLSLPKKYQWCKWNGNLPGILLSKIEMAFDNSRPAIEIKRNKAKILFRILTVDSNGTVRRIIVEDQYFGANTKDKATGEKRRRALEFLHDIELTSNDLFELVSLSNAVLALKKKGA